MGIHQHGMRRLIGWTARGGVVLVVVTAGCGGSGRSSDPPRLPHALGARLAETASAVQASLDRGDACAAAAEAAQLRLMVDSAITSGDVPSALRAPLSSSVGSLVDEITCVPPPAAKPKNDHKPPGHDQGNGHGPGRGHGPGHDHGGDGGGD